MISFIIIDDKNENSNAISMIKNNTDIIKYDYEIIVCDQSDINKTIELVKNNFVCILESGVYTNVVMLEDIFKEIGSEDLYILPYLLKDQDKYNIGNFLEKDGVLNLSLMSTEHMSFIFDKSLFVDFTETKQFIEDIYGRSIKNKYIHNIDWFCHIKVVD